MICNEFLNFARRCNDEIKLQTKIPSFWSLSVKELWHLANVSFSYDQKSSVLFFSDTLYIYEVWKNTQAA